MSSGKTESRKEQIVISYFLATAGLPYDCGPGTENCSVEAGLHVKVATVQYDGSHSCHMLENCC